MSRSDGTFPAYVRINIDPELWPDDYWDKSQKCSECGTLWPHPHLFNPSICCGVRCEIQDGPPDMRWPEAVKALLTERFEDLYDTWNEGKTDRELPDNTEITEVTDGEGIRAKDAERLEARK